MSQNESDRALTKLAVSGDAKALEQLILLYYPDVSNFARKVCRNPQDAEDATQHTISALAQNVSQFRQEAKLTTWLFTVVKNECLRLKNKFMKLKGSIEEAHRESSDTGTEAIKEFLLTLMSQLISEMPAEDRELIVLHEIDGQPLKVIADQMKVPLNTVKTRIRRARLSLKEKMETSIQSDQ